MKYIILLLAILLSITSASAKKKTPFIIIPQKDTLQTIIPKPITKGSKIAIITPSTKVDANKVMQCAINLKSMGYETMVMENAFGKFGSYTACDSARAADIMNAFKDPEVSAILCSRGGYGATRLLPYLNLDTIRNHPKWLIGYSDITALHAFLKHAGVASIHGPMSTHIAAAPNDAESTYLFQILTEGLPFSYTLKSHSYNKPGSATGTLVGGNLIVANELSETPYDVFNLGKDEDIIIFVEDVGEKIYAIERLLVRLHQSGILGRVKGLIFGEFTDYTADEDFRTMESMIYSRLNEWGYYDKNDFPIMYEFPAGHGHPNFPLVLGAKATLIVSPDSTTLIFHQ